MIPRLRGLRMAGDMGAVRSPISYLFFGVVDFICFLMAAESLNALQYARAVKWAIAGVAALLVGYCWPRIKQKLRGGAPVDLPEFRPKLIPVDYAEAEKRLGCGLYIRNPGYDALDVEIPSVPIGQSGFNLVFHERLAQFGERSGNAFFEAWLESKEQGGRDGCDLHEIMRKSDLEVVNFAIIYKDTDFRSYRTNCVIERTNRTRNGLEVKAVSQEMVSQ